MKILVTGGAGFLGSHLANELYRQGHLVRVLDDMSGAEPSPPDERVLLHRGDVRDVPRLWSLLQGIEVVYHLAARVSVPASVLYPREYNDVNTGGTVALLEACRDVHSVRRIVLASSATVYGNQESQPVSETMSPVPGSPYAVSKLAAEHYLFTIGRQSGIETVALRIFNAYGPGQPVPPAHAPVVPQFCQQIVGRGSVIVSGDGQQTRDFVFVDDVVDALVSAGQAADVDGQTINIGSGNETSINDLISRIESIVRSKANVLYNREASGGIRRLVADISRARALLKYRPRTQLDAGLRALIQTDPKIRRSTQTAESPSPGATNTPGEK